MNKRYGALKTLVRNKLNNSATTLQEKMNWFHEKGIQLNIDDKDPDLFFLRADTGGHASELTGFCANGIIYRGLELICFFGRPISEMKLSEAKELTTFIWNKDVTFIEDLPGRNVYMYWDPRVNVYRFSDDKKIHSSYMGIVKKYIYNMMESEFIFTYVFRYVETRDKSGLYLTTMFDNRDGQEQNDNVVVMYANRFKAKTLKRFKFEGFDKLESSDFPLFAEDVSKTKLYLTSI